MSTLPPWAQGPFELIVHAEEHLRNGEDFDRRIALISFDNAVEVAITTYLSLNPIQRGGKTYTRADVDNWLNNYHTKLGFFEQELTSRELPWEVEKSYIIYAHDHRNEQYHGGAKGTPEKQVLDIIRKASIWIMSVLYGYSFIEMEKILNDTIAAKLPPLPPKREPELDEAIDDFYDVVFLAGEKYDTSELLFEIDPNLYRDYGLALIDKRHEDGTDQ